jgi:hypothetical protein
MHPQAQHEMTKLMASWTLAGALIVTVIILLLSLVRFLNLSDARRRMKLICILGAEIVAAGIAYSLGGFQPAPDAAIKTIEQPLKANAAKLQQEIGLANAERDHLRTELSEAKRQLAESATKLAADDLQIAQANVLAENQSKELASLHEFAERVSSQKPVVDQDEVNAFNALKARAEKSEADLAESRQNEAALNQKLKESQSKVSAIERMRREKERQLQRAKAVGQVLAVNPGWNFVVLSIGDKQGVNPDSTLLVLRGGEQIAKLRVKSVEPSKSIADVIFKSLRKGASVRPGDSVVVEEIRAQPTAMSQPPATQSAASLEPALPLLPPLPR